MARELSDDALLRQLAAFLSYRDRGGGLPFAAWADTKQFTPADRTYLEVAFNMVATLPHWLAS